MISVKIKLRITLFTLLLAALLFNSCKTLNESSEGCVVSFIVAAENRNMNRAWDILSPEAQQYYNGQGEKMRKSGKGALENEIARIIKFRSIKKDYRLEIDSSNNMNINIVVIGGPTHIVATENIEGNYKIKNETSVRSLLEAITLESKKNEGY